MYKEKFVLSVIHDGQPVKESGIGSNREVAIPFGSEYKIRLKNKNNRSCTARVFVDGKKLSVLGDVVISAGGTIDLERFIDRSLSEGKRLKFVSLDDTNIDDPTDSSNGIIRVEFRLAKNEVIKIKHDDIPRHPSPFVWHYFDSRPTKKKGPYNEDLTQVYCCSSFSTTPVNSFNCNVENGATVEGSNSKQQFVYSELEVMDIPVVVLQLKLVGLRKRDMAMTVLYCTKCGKKIKNVLDKYCSMCGNRLT